MEVLHVAYTSLQSMQSGKGDVRHDQLRGTSRRIDKTGNINSRTQIGGWESHLGERLLAHRPACRGMRRSKRLRAELLPLPPPQRIDRWRRLRPGRSWRVETLVHQPIPHRHPRRATTLQGKQ